MGIYINGIGLISPQETRDNNLFLESIIELENTYFPIVKPPYKDYINGRDLRRMSLVLRHGIIAAKIALTDANIENPDAIMTGTGLGCVIDTEKFLVKMCENKETLLTPTAFIQSTHNTLGGSIAIGLGCHNYNMTFVNRGFSFESALLDAQLMMDEGEIKNALVGGFDEMTDYHIKLMQVMPMFKPENGAKVGQGSGFFVIENQKSDHSYAEILALETLYRPSDSVFDKRLTSLRNQFSLNSKNTVLLLGHNGTKTEDEVYNNFAKVYFPNATITSFKHLCGEYYTASAFAFWVASQVLKKQSVPKTLLRTDFNNTNIDHILIYNRFNETEHSLILLKRC